MKLFNKYQSRALQFALDLLAQLQSTALSTSQIQALAQQWGLDYADQVIQPLCRAGFLEQTTDGYRLTADGTLPRLPLSAAERSTLAALLQIPESQLFLEPALWEHLAALCAGTPAPPSVQRYAPAGGPLPQHPGPEGFRTLLKAAQRRWLIRYTCYTRDHQTVPRQAEALPWKLEYSAYDRHWWVILYDPGQARTIKARLDNLEEIRLLGPSGVEDGEVEAAWTVCWSRNRWCWRSAGPGERWSGVFWYWKTSSLSGPVRSPRTAFMSASGTTALTGARSSGGFCTWARASGSFPRRICVKLWSLCWIRPWKHDFYRK